MPDAKDKIILYLGSGVMAGVFGAGFLQALEEKNFYEHIRAIHATSAGAINAAYFLARQTDLGIRIYFEDLIHGFITPRRLPRAIVERIWHRFVRPIPETSIRNVVDITYLFEVITHKKILDINALRAQPIPLYVKVLRMRDQKIRYIDITSAKDPLAVLHAAVSTIPYYFPSSDIKGERYIDAGVKEPIGLQWLLNQYPRNNIALVLNEQKIKSRQRRIRSICDGIIGACTYDMALCRSYMNKELLLRRDLALAREHRERVFVFRHPDDSPTDRLTTDPHKLREAAEMGRRAGQELISLLRQKSAS